MYPNRLYGIKLDINSKENHKNPRRLNNTLLNDQYIIDNIRKEIKKFIDSNENEDTKPVGYSKSSLKREFIAISAHIRKLERSQINNLMIHLKLLEKQE
jgi:hypothetical protein